MTRYSQNDEQDFILKFFNGRCGGNFLDIGAHDGESLSNTRALALRGWRGTLVEPHPVHFHKLWQLYGGQPSFVLVNAAVDSCNRGVVRLYYNYEWPAYSSTLCSEKATEFRANDYSKSFYVSACGIRELVKFGPFDFISLDAEGMEIPLLANASELLEPCSLLCIETCPKSKPTILTQLGGFNLEVTAETPENLICQKLPNHQSK